MSSETGTYKVVLHKTLSQFKSHFKLKYGQNYIL